jgi:hypothetical protein
MVSVRTVTISGQDYLQAVRYVKVEGKPKVEVIKSFGQDNIENRMKAEQFAASYDKLIEILKQTKNQGIEADKLLETALAIFGLILGAAIIVAIINEIFGDN